MGDLRSFSSHVRWTDAEIAVLRTLYPVAAWSEILSALPGRWRRQADSKARGLGLRRPAVEPRSADEVREAKRAHMAQRRAADPDRTRAQQRAWRLLTAPVREVVEEGVGA